MIRRPQRDHYRFQWILPILAVLLGTAGATPATAAFKYVAFGDSRTKAQGGGCGPEEWCKYDNTPKWNNGGWPARLYSTDPKMGLGSEAKVVNEGEPGESTAEGLTRIDSVLRDGYQVLLLAEGINDLLFPELSISPETVRDNLKSMEIKAVGYGTDTVYAAVMRKNRDKNYGPVTDLKNLLKTLASQRGRYYVEDNWTDLCPNGTCFDNHYYFSDTGVDPAGHPDASGYDIAAENWADVITKTPIPGATTLIAPSGDFAGTEPTYSWDAIGEANYYNLIVKGPGGAKVEDTWHRSSQKCSGGVCTTGAKKTVSDGLHTWTVQTRNPWGLGPKSSEGSFDVYVNPPAVPLGSLPVGDDYCGSLDDPFTWNDVDRTQQYRLVISDDQGGELWNTVYEQSVVCSADTCSVVDPLGLGGGSYNWQVSGLNPAGEGAFSAALAFELAISAPGLATTQEPSWRTYDTTPEFSWLEVPTADMYQLKLNGVNQGFLDAVDICANGTCAFTPAAPLVPDEHGWKIQAANCIGNGAFSPQVLFTVVPCTNPVDRTLDAGEVTAPPGDLVEEACDRLAVTPLGPYRIRASANDVIFHTSGTGVIELFDGFAVDTGASFLAVVDK